MTRIATASSSVGRAPQVDYPVTLGQPTYSHAVAALGTPQPAGPDRPYEDVGKLQLNLLGGGATLEPGQVPNETGGLIAGFLGAVGGTFGQTGSDIGQTIGKAVEIPVGLGGNVLGAAGSVPIPFGTEIARLIGAGYRAVTGDHEGDPAPTVISDLISPFQQQGGVSLGGVFQTAVGGIGLLERTIQRSYAGTRRPGDLPADIEAAIMAGTITREEGVDQAVARGQGYTNDAMHNMLWSILLDPLSWLSLGVGGVAKAASAGTKIGRAAEIANMIERGVDIAPNAARLLRLGKLEGVAGRVTDPMLAAAELRKLGPAERLSLNTIGRLPGFNEVLVPVSNQVIRLTDPLRLFSGGKIGVRTAEVVATSASAGVATAYGLDTVHHIGGIIDGLVQGGRAKVNRGIGMLTTNYLYRYAADDLAHEFAKAGHIPGIDGEANRAMNPTAFFRGVMERGPFDASIGGDVEVMGEKLMPFDTFAEEGKRTADTAKRLAYATGADESSILGKLKGTFKEWALSHALSYIEASRKLVEEVRPAMAALTDLPVEYADASRFTLVAKDTLTHNRWQKISKLVEDGKDLDAIREEVGRYADFTWLNADGMNGDELLDALRRWGDENSGGLLKEVDVRLPSGALKPDVPAPLRAWLTDVEKMDYTLTLMPPEGAERAMWRVTRDADGKIININPFIEFQTEAQMMKDPRWFQRLMSQGFRQIRTERILWTMRRRFVTEMSSDGRLTPHAAESIYKSIMYSANERGMTPRALKPSEIMEAAKRALKTEQAKGNVGLGTMSEVEITKRLVVAFEGDLSLVGLTQKITGRAKVALPGASENTWGQIAERLYPMARFTLNHFFMLQEIVEPYILGIMRGVPVPLDRHAEKFERALALRQALDNLVRSDLTPDGVMMEVAETQKIIQAGMEMAHTFYGSGTRLGRAIGGVWGQTAARKGAATGLMAMNVTGDLMKQSFTEMRGPEFWAELERLYGTRDTAVIAERWLAQAFYIADGNGERVTAIMDIVKPENIGAATRVFKGKGPGVRWHHVAGLLGMTEEGADEKLLESLKLGRLIDDTARTPLGRVEGAMSYGQWMRKATDAGMDEKFADRAYKMATGPEVDEFWEGWHDVMAGTTATKEVKDQSTRAIRGITLARARVMGLSEEEFIKLHYAAPPGFSQEAAIAGVEALFQSVDNMAAVIVERHGAPPGVEFLNRESLLGAVWENRETTPRTGAGATDLNGLTEKIRAKGFKPTMPITLHYDPVAHAVTIGDGNTRMAAAARLNLENVPVQVKVLPGGGRYVGKFIPVEGVAKEGLVPGTFVSPSDIGLTPVAAKSNSLHAVLDGLPVDANDPSTKFQSRIGTMLLGQDGALMEGETRRATVAAYREIDASLARFGKDARGNATTPPQFKSEPGYVYRTVAQGRASNDWRVGEYVATHPATIYADSNTSVVLRTREDVVEWEDAVGGVNASANKRAKAVVASAHVEVLGVDGTWKPVASLKPQLSQAHEVMGALTPEVAGHHYFNYLAVNNPERLRAVIPTLDATDAYYVQNVLDRVDVLKSRPRFVFKSADGKPYYLGSVEPQDLVDMAVEWMPQHEGLAAKDWYIGIREGIKNLFGESNADTVLRMFSVSQANASPISGMMNVLRALEQSFALGFEQGSIRQREFLTAAVRKVLTDEGKVEGKTLQLNAENIVKAMLDLPIDRNYAAKLNDFTDSVLGNSTRRWTGRVGGNMPVAVDRHTARDVGYMDQKVLTHLAESPYATHLPNGVVVVRDSNEQVVVTMREDITTKMKEEIDPDTGEVTMKEVNEARWNLVDLDGNYVDRKGVRTDRPTVAAVTTKRGKRFEGQKTFETEFEKDVSDWTEGLIKTHGKANEIEVIDLPLKRDWEGAPTIKIKGYEPPPRPLNEMLRAYVQYDDGGRVAGYALMPLTEEGKASAVVQVRVRPDVQRGGIASRLYAQADADGLDVKAASGNWGLSGEGKPFSATYKERGYEPRRVAAADMEGRPDDLQYENGVDLINRATEKFNNYVDPKTGIQGVWGRTDWRPEEVQAVGWMRVQKTVGGAEESPLDTLSAHHYAVAYEVSAEDGSPWARAQPIFEDMPDLSRKQMISDLDVIFAQWAETKLGVNITSAGFVGDARWGGGYRTYSAPGMLLGTSESADDMADLRALVFRQKEVWAYHPAPISNFVRATGKNDAAAHYAAVDIIIPVARHGDTDAADDIAHSIQDALDAPGCTVFPDANGNLRLRVVDRPLNPETYELDTNFFFFKQHDADGEYADGTKYKAGMTDREDVKAKLEAAYVKAEIDPDGLGIDHTLAHGTVYIAGPRRRVPLASRADVVKWADAYVSDVKPARGREIGALWDAADPDNSDINFLLPYGDEIANEFRAVQKEASESARGYLARWDAGDRDPEILDQLLGELNDSDVVPLVPIGGYVYHGTSSRHLDSIRTNGLRPSKGGEGGRGVGGPGSPYKAVVWFGSDPTDVVGYKQDTLLRVKRTRGINPFTDNMETDFAATSKINPEAIEVLGADGNWQPLTQSGRPPQVISDIPRTAVDTPYLERMAPEDAAWMREHGQEVPEDAVRAPLAEGEIRSFTSWEPATQWAEDTGFAIPKAALKPEQNGAINRYSGGSSRVVNEGARAGVEDDIAPLLDEVMKPIPEPVLAVRFADVLPGGINPADVKVGQELVDDGFLSTSLASEVNRGGKVRMEIEIDAGTQGLWVDTHSSVQGEAELLVARRTPFRVLSVDNVDGVQVVRMRTVPAPVPQSEFMWETHLEDTVGRLRQRGRTVDEGSLGDLQSQINTALDAHLRKSNPTRYDDVARGGAVLHDRRTAGILGYTRRTNDGRVIVGATQRANVTTGLHELAHVFATDLDESARALIQRARATALTAQRTDLDARIADLDLKIAGAASRTTKAKYRAQKNALVHDLGELVDEAAWGPQHEEWFADEFNRWVKNGRVENRELNGLFEHFRNWLSEVWDTIRGHKVEKPSPEMEELFNSMFDNRVPTVAYDLDQGAMMLSGKQKVRQGMDNAETTQYFKKGRSFVERSINHPFLGMYPASYYWGKILPEMIKFLALRPFGMKTPLLAWNVLREVSDTVRMQQTLDPSIKQWLKDNEEGLMTLNMLFPAVPNDIPVNAPLWARRIAEQGLENADLVAQGQAAKPIDYSKGLADSAAWVFGPYASLERAGGLLASAGDVGRMAVKNVTGVDMATGAKPASQLAAVSEVINPYTGEPFAAIPPTQ